MQVPLKSLFLSFAISVLPVGVANALTITLDDQDRTGTLSDATKGASYNGGNLKPEIVAAAFGGAWTSEGNISSGLSDDMLSMTFTKGSWNGVDVAGTWTINPVFWSLYEDAVIGWHVGNGGGNPDAFMFEIKPGETTGSWSYHVDSGKGGGFSNFQLFGSGAPHRVPDGGSTVALLGLAVSGVAIARRLVKKA